jgi:autophagy-related protein 2
VTWHPKARITPENKIANDESEVTIQILPLRCILDQRAIAFTRALFNADNDGDTPTTTSVPQGMHVIPPPLFRSLRMKSFKVRVDYTPQDIDAYALRHGSLVELVNLMPIERMVLTLQAVLVKNEVGFGSAMSVVVRRWVEDICSTQLAKFVANARPFEPITQVCGASVDMMIMPYDALSKGHSVKKAIRVGAKTLTKTFMTEAITVTSRTAAFLAGNISKVASLNQNDPIVPKRPYHSPKDFAEATPHAVAAITRGLQVTNHKIIIIPYREYQRSGVTGAVTSVLKGIPVAVAAPASATAEAVSFGLLGVRNQFRPDLRKEEELIKLKNHLFDK